jgi:CO dehydrogenase maturation factor
MLEKVKSSLGQGGAAMGSMPGGLSKHDYLSYEIQSSLAEGDRFDLIAMGRGEGPGCYCAVNHNLRDVIDKISKNYSYVVIDNEAGMEHLSRRTTRDVQHLLVVTDPTLRGLVAAERIIEMQKELSINIEKTYLILNRIVGEPPVQLIEKIRQLDVIFLGSIPSDNELMAFEFEGKPLVNLGDESPVYQAVSKMMQSILD